MRGRRRVLCLFGLSFAAFAACGGDANVSPNDPSAVSPGGGGDGGTGLADGQTLGPDGQILGPDGEVIGSDAAPKDDDAGPPHPPVTGLTQFTEITSSSTLGAIQSGMVWTFDHAMEDFDGDGRLDLFLGDHDTTGNQNRLAHNDGNDLFSNKLGGALSSAGVTGVWSFMAVDANDDGAVDALVNWDAQNSVAFVNDKAGGFTKQSNPFDHQANGMAWADYDGDGFLDFAVTNYGSPNKLWRHKNATGLGQADFEDKTASGGMVTGKSSAAIYLADLDGDARPDLVMQSLTNGTIFEGATGCQTKVALNTGAGFGAPSTAGLDAAPCYGIALGDFDNDGDLDLAAVGAAPGGNSSAGNGNVLLGMRLFRNAGNGTFSDVTSSAQLPTTTTSVDVYRHIYDQLTWVDVDQDGFLDLVVTLGSDKIYRNLGNRTFQDVTSTWKLTAGGGRPERLFGGDIDGDGDVDLLTQSGQAQGYRLWRNDLGSANWLTIRLEGTKIKTAVSSKIFLYEAGHANDGAFLRGYREVMVSASHRAPLEQTFGTEAGKTYDVVAQFWPDKTKVTIPAVAPGKRLRIREDGSSVAY
jgi:hypothetical protein